MLGKHKQEDLRKRKAEGKGIDDEYVEPLDEDDQMRIILQLRDQADQQQASILRTFRYLCYVASVVVLLSVLYFDQWHLSSSLSLTDNSLSKLVRPCLLGHGMCSALLHGNSPTLTTGTKVGAIFRLSVAMDLLVATSALWLTRRFINEDETLLWMHYGILVSNGFVVMVALLLKMDSASTDKAFTDLMGAKYRYKSL